MRELFDIEVDSAALLPEDDVSDGFDNIANVLKVSPSFLDQYIAAARAVSRQAVGDPPPAGPTRVLLRGNLNRDPFVEGGLPLGLQPGMLVEHLFPADAEYELRVNGDAVVTLDGVKVATTGRVSVKAGTHKVGLAIPARSLVESESLFQSFVTGGLTRLERACHVLGISPGSVRSGLERSPEPKISTRRALPLVPSLESCGRHARKKVRPSQPGGDSPDKAWSQTGSAATRQEPGTGAPPDGSRRLAPDNWGLNLPSSCGISLTRLFW
jgi:hypothetical protein